jgi:hypothetical protein
VLAAGLGTAFGVAVVILAPHPAGQARRPQRKAATRHMPPGHAPAAEAGTEVLQISPADKLAEVEAAIAVAMQGEPGR